MNTLIELIDRRTYKYKGTYSLPHTHLDITDEYVYFVSRNHILTSKETNVNSDEAEIGILDIEGLSLYPSKAKLGRIYIGSVKVQPKNNRYNTGSVDDPVYVFQGFLYNYSFTEKKDFQFKGTVHEFAGCCQVLNFYIENGFDIQTCQIEKLQNKARRYFDRTGTEPFKVLEISDNIQFTDYIAFLNTAENTAHTSCNYSTRHGEYAHSYWETLFFRTSNLAFAEITEKILCQEKIQKDDYYCIEYEFIEDTDYSGGLSVMVEKEGVEEVEPKGIFKKETIMKLINESCRTFPSELYMICKLISADNKTNTQP